MRLTSAEFKRLVELALSASQPIHQTLSMFDALKRAHQMAAVGTDVVLDTPPAVESGNAD